MLLNPPSRNIRLTHKGKLIRKMGNCPLAACVPGIPRDSRADLSCSTNRCYVVHSGVTLNYGLIFSVKLNDPCFLSPSPESCLTNTAARRWDHITAE